MIATDFLGLWPLYCKHEGKDILFSSATRAFSGDFDPVGWGAFFTLGSAVGSHTLTHGVQRVDGGSIWTIDLVDRQYQIRRYWSLNTSTPDNSYSLSDIHERLHQSMKRTLDEAPDVSQSIMMSGGFDSRLMMAMLSETNANVQPIVVSHYDENSDADARFALTILKKFGIKSSIQTPDYDFFSSESFLDYLFNSDAETPSLYLFIAQVFQFIPPGMVWDGLLPGCTLVNPLHEVEDGGCFASFLAQEGKSIKGPVWNAVREVFRSDIADSFEEGFRKAWKEVTSQYSDDEDGIARYYLENRARHRTGINPFKAFQSKSQVVTLGMTKDYVEAAMAIPATEKRNHRLYRELFREYHRRALSAPLVHGNKLEPPEHFSPKFQLFCAYNRINEELRKHPRLIRSLGLNSQYRGFSPSAFLGREFMRSEDPALDPKFLDKIKNNKSVSPISKKLLFHWKVWRSLREGRFYEMLL